MSNNSGSSRRRAIKAAYDPANPPPGARLGFGHTATKLRITVSDMADAADISRTAIANLLTNDWPVRTDASAIRAALHDLFSARGANDHELSTLFHAHGHGGFANRPEKRQGHFETGPDARAPELPVYDPTRKTAGATTAAGPTAEEIQMLIAKQTLSPAARRAFQLLHNPFDGEVVRDQDFFAGDDFRWVREAAHQCVMNSSFVAIVGESGAGKTTVLSDLEARLLHEQRGVTIIRPSVLGMEESNAAGHKLKSTDVLHACITALEPGATVPLTLQARTVRTHKLLVQSAEAGHQHLLVIEEAHGLPDATLKHLKRLHEMRQGRRPLLGILLLGQPELKKRLESGLRNGKLREVAQRCEVVQLLPLDNDLQAYLDCRMAPTGRPLSQLLEDGAVDALRARLTRHADGEAVSMCYPLAVNNMVTRALNKAAEIGAPAVSAAIFKLL